MAQNVETILTGRFRDPLNPQINSNHDVSSCGGQMDGLKHSHRLEAASVRLECARSKGELERERDALQGQLEGEEHTHTCIHVAHYSGTDAVSVCDEDLKFHIYPQQVPI